MFGKIVAVVLIVLLGLFIIGTVKSMIVSLKERKKKNTAPDEVQEGEKKE